MRFVNITLSEMDSLRMHLNDTCVRARLPNKEGGIIYCNEIGACVAKYKENHSDDYKHREINLIFKNITFVYAYEQKMA